MVLMSEIRDLAREANELCEKALNDAKEKLHPLSRSVDVNRLDKRSEFLQAFRSALERRIAKKLAAWQPAVQSVFRFDSLHAIHDAAWDGKIHLLVKVPRLSNTVKTIGERLDQYLLRHFRQSGWLRFQKQQSMLEVQQVTINELRHGVSYGAMFYAVYCVPVKVWPLKKTR
jgi:hypothetical protein